IVVARQSKNQAGRAGVPARVAPNNARTGNEPAARRARGPLQRTCVNLLDDALFVEFDPLGVPPGLSPCTDRSPSFAGFAIGCNIAPALKCLNRLATFRLLIVLPLSSLEIRAACGLEVIE